MRNHTITKAVFFLTILALAPGGLTLLYSQTFIHSGMGATDYWWGYGYTYSSVVFLSVSNSTPIVTETLHSEQLTIREFNITGGNVSIVVSCETNGTIATYDSITGEHAVYLTYPTAEPTGNHDQDFNVTILFKENNATVIFDYYFNMAMHGDESVTWIEQGYEDVRTLGEFLVVGGLVLVGILLSVSLISIVLNKQPTDKQ